MQGAPVFRGNELHEAVHGPAQPGFPAPLQHLGAAHRRQGQGLQEGKDDRHGYGDAELEEKFPYDPLHEHDRDEDGQDGQGGGHCRGGDLPGPHDGRLDAAHAAFEVADDVFHDHDGVVHDDADDQGKPQEREGVEGEAEEIEHDEGPDEGRGYGQYDVEG